MDVMDVHWLWSNESRRWLDDVFYRPFAQVGALNAGIHDL